jgi:hypothetical protein
VAHWQRTEKLTGRPQRLNTEKPATISISVFAAFVALLFKESVFVSFVSCGEFVFLFVFVHESQARPDANDGDAVYKMRYDIRENRTGKEAKNIVQKGHIDCPSSTRVAL